MQAVKTIGLDIAKSVFQVLGLSISHDIIVKQHGGSIEVDTQPGAFTEFRIILPRTAVVSLP